MIKNKYFRIHTKDIAYITQKPRGLFTAIGKLVDQNILTESEIKEYWENRQWFEANLPVPTFYNDGNSVKAITWFKSSEQGFEMFYKMTFYIEMANKYELPLFITQTDIIHGRIIYEDIYQIGVIESKCLTGDYQTSEFRL